MQPFKVAGNLIDDVMSEARPVKDVHAVFDLVLRMQNCVVTLDHLGCMSDPGVLHALESAYGICHPTYRSAGQKRWS